MKSGKIRILNPLHCSEVQEWLFSQGYSWKSFGQELNWLQTKFLFFRDTGFITQNVDEKTFLEVDLPEVTYCKDLQSDNPIYEVY